MLRMCGPKYVLCGLVSFLTSSSLCAINTLCMYTHSTTALHTMSDGICRFSDGGTPPPSPPVVPSHWSQASTWYSAVWPTRYRENPDR